MYSLTDGKFRSKALVVSMAIVAMVAALSLSRVSADWTTTRCDPTPKYYCSAVNFTRQYSTWPPTLYIQDRAFQGSIDGLPDADWRLYRVWDYADTNPGSGYYYYQTHWGPSSWLSNSTFSPWYSFVNDERSYQYNLLIRFQFEFYECPPPQPGGPCTYWYGPATFGPQSDHLINQIP